MKRTVGRIICIMLCILSLCGGCYADEAAQTNPTVLETPSIDSVQDEQLFEQDDLQLKISALEEPEPSIIKTGENRYYVTTQVSNATGSISRHDIDKLAAEIMESDGKTLNDVFEPYGLIDENQGGLKINYSEYAEEPGYEFYTEILTYENEAVLSLNIIEISESKYPYSVIHLLFCLSQDSYQFRGIIREISESPVSVHQGSASRDEIVRCGDMLYFVCRDGDESGSGEVSHYTHYCCLTVSAPVLSFKDEFSWNGTGVKGYELVSNISPLGFEMMSDKRLSLNLQLDFCYDAYETDSEFLKDNTNVSYQLCLFNDLDDKGFYSYDEETVHFFRSPALIAYIQNTLKPRLELITQSSDPELRRMAEEILIDPSIGY